MVVAVPRPVSAGAVTARAAGVVSASTTSRGTGGGASSSARLGGGGGGVGCRLPPPRASFFRGGGGVGVTHLADASSSSSSWVTFGGGIKGGREGRARRRVKRRGDAAGNACRASAVPAETVSSLMPPVETVSSLISDSIPAVMQQPAGLTFSQTMVYSACFAIGKGPTKCTTQRATQHVKRTALTAQTQFVESRRRRLRLSSVFLPASQHQRMTVHKTHQPRHVCVRLRGVTFFF